MTNTEYRTVIKFFIRKGLSATEITKDLADVYGRSTPSYRIVAVWVAEFKDSTHAFDDPPRSGRIPTALTEESIRAVEKIVMRDRQISVRREADELYISITLLYEIISDYLGMKKVCMRLAPKLLTPLQCAARADCCEAFLENCNQDSTAFFGRIVTENATWIRRYDSFSQQEATNLEENRQKTHQADHDSHHRLSRSS